MRDDEGLELADVAAARNEATRGLADLARDALPGTVHRELAVYVRDVGDPLVLKAGLWFEVAETRPTAGSR